MKKCHRLYHLLVIIIAVVCIYPLGDKQLANAKLDDNVVTIKILGINDFHGQVVTGQRSGNRPVGSAPVLAAYLKQAEKGMEDRTVITFMGDQVGASPPASALLRDEPTILFFNTLANHFCTKAYRMNPKCNMVATLGNHEFDHGQAAMLKLIYGSEQPPTKNWTHLAHYPGAVFPYVSANVISNKTKQPILPPYVIKNVDGVSVAFIGVILRDAHEVILPSSIEGLSFLDEADAVNHYVPEMKAKGAEVIVVIMHQGGGQLPYEGNTKKNQLVAGPIKDIVKRLDDSVDVVMAGHTHSFLNAYLPNQHGKKMLVTEADCYSTAYADIDITFNRHTHTIVSKSAQIVTTYADQGPGLSPDPAAMEITNKVHAVVDPIINKKIAVLANELAKLPQSTGESELGDLVADAFRHEMNTDISVINPGSVRANLYAGDLTIGDIYTILPYYNDVVVISLTGAQLYELFEQQWNNSRTLFLQISGMQYRYDLSKPIGSRVVAITIHDKIIARDATPYTVATNSFLAGGGDGFTVLKNGLLVKTGDVDNALMVDYIESLPQPITYHIDGRIQPVS